MTFKLSKIESTLLYHIDENRPWKIRKMLRKGVNPNLIINDNGCTILNYAISERRGKAAITLIKKGADINLQGEEGKTPLIVATERFSLYLVRFLLKNGADINSIDNEKKNCPFLRLTGNYARAY